LATFSDARAWLIFTENSIFREKTNHFLAGLQPETTGKAAAKPAVIASRSRKTNDGAPNGCNVLTFLVVSYAVDVAGPRVL